MTNFSKRLGWAATLALALHINAAGAQQQGTSPFAGRMSRNQPIEITANNLEVQQNNNLAIFSGAVEVIQGDMRLRAERLRVYYVQNNAPGAQPARRPQQAGQPDQSIRRIEAEGKVFVSSPEETAQGDLGLYDVEGGTITLTGNVVLTQGENVLRGNRAVMNMNTGRSVMESGGQSGRVRGLFMPGRDNQTPPKP